MSTKKVAIIGLGIALYVAISMLLKIPIGIGHLALDLGYIVLAVYCYLYGATIGAIVGACGCTLVSLLASGMFPLGWLLGNAFIGCACGRAFRRVHRPWSMALIAIAAVFIGVAVIKTIVECLLFQIPLVVKFSKNTVAAATDAAVMAIGTFIAPKVESILHKEALG